MLAAWFNAVAQPSAVGDEARIFDEEDDRRFAECDELGDRATNQLQLAIQKTRVSIGEKVPFDGAQPLRGCQHVLLAVLYVYVGDRLVVGGPNSSSLGDERTGGEGFDAETAIDLAARNRLPGP